jgi:MFS family permease
VSIDLTSRASARARVLVAFAALGVWWGAWGALVPAIQAHAQVSDGELGAAMLFVGVGALMSMRAAGTWMDRRGEVVLPLTVAALGLVGIFPGLAHGVVALAVALAAVGAASGAMDVAINTASVRAEESTGAPLMSLAHGLFSIGVIAAALAGGAARAADVPPAAILAVVAGLLVAAAIWLHPFAGASAEIPDGSSTTAAMPWWRVPRRLAFIGALVALAFFVESAWQSWSALHLERDLDATPFVGALGPAVFAIAAASGRLLGHVAEVRHPERSLVVAGSLLATAGSVLGGVAPNAWASLLGIAAAGIGTAVLAPTLLRTAGLAGDASLRGAAVGSVITIGYLGFVVGPAVVGGLATATTLPVALAVVGLAGLVLAVAGPRAR